MSKWRRSLGAGTYVVGGFSTPPLLGRKKKTDLDFVCGSGIALAKAV